MMAARIALFFGFLLAGMGITTQWIASSFAYNSVLGSAVFELVGIPIYWPWAFFGWSINLYELQPGAFSIQMLPFIVSAVLGALAASLLRTLSGIPRGTLLTSHGSAHWASPKEIERSGLLVASGVVLGLTGDGKRYVRHDGPEHVCVFAPTRSGKGVGLVVPTLLSWTHSVVCFDPKGENWGLTSGFREKLGRCLYFNPTSLKSARFNPLMEVRAGQHEVKDVQNIADMLVDPDGSSRPRSHWERTAHSLLVGAITHVINSEPDKTLSGLAFFLAHPERTFDETLKIMVQSSHPVVASTARELLNKAPEELSGVLSTAISFLSLYRDPTVAQATSMSDFKISDLMSSKEPLSLYLVVPPSDLSRTKCLIRLILNQIGRRLTEDMNNKEHRLLFLLDEFPALGKLDFFESALAYIAGYGIKAFLITQSLNQIEAAYGSHNSILDNCHVRVAFASNDERMARRISDLLGVQTAQKEQRSLSGNRDALFLNKRSISYQEYSRPLLTPSEVTQLGADEEIIFTSGCPPIRAKKLKYYEDLNFSRRVLTPAVDVEYEDAEKSENKQKDAIDSNKVERLNTEGVAL